MYSCWFVSSMLKFQNITLNHSLHKSCINQATEYFFCVGKSVRSQQHSCLQVRWNKPSEGWYKLNTNEASLGSPGKAGGGGVIQDHRGNWVQGFAQSIGFTTSVISEFWALRNGLIMTSQMGIPFLQVEMDAKIVVDLVLSNSISNKAYSPLLNDCRFLLHKFWQVKVKHIFREVNKVAA